MSKFYDCVNCSDFNDFIEKVQSLPCGQGHNWIFRGHQKACWDLTTSLERECRRFGISGDEAFRREYNMVREFQRRLHHYEIGVPNRDCVDEWMGLMQHYGAPTRLLDFTYSPYVAAYFAFERAKSRKVTPDSSDAGRQNNHGKVAVWAVDIGWIDQKLKKEMGH